MYSHCTLHSSRTWNNLPGHSFPRRTGNNRRRGHQINRLSRLLSSSPQPSVSPRSPRRRISQSLRDLPFAEALVQFSTWYSTLTPDQQLQVERAMGDVEAIEQTAVREPEEAAAD